MPRRRSAAGSIGWNREVARRIRDGRKLDTNDRKAVPEIARAALDEADLAGTGDGED